MTDPHQVNKSYVIGVDVGGTFTDVFVLDQAQSKIKVLKVPSTVGRSGGDQSQGFLEGIRRAVGDTSSGQGDAKNGYAAIATIVHGTTAGTNALLERKMARTGLIATRGFRDVLEMRRRDRPATWGLWGQFEPVIERRLRREVDERVLANGDILGLVDLEQVRAHAIELQALGCEALVIAFINAYANPKNEQLALAAAREVWQGDYISASHQILPEIREFERTSTAALNAALQPVVGRYVEKLDAGLKESGFQGQLLIVQSNGGVMDVATTCRAPVKTALSGPAAGVMACAYLAREAGFLDVITGDVGGTSFDVSLISAGAPALASQTSIEFGMVIRSPMIEITTIGAGGGSIAGVDASGLLQVGPLSAGSFPGPVCYGLRSDSTIGPCVTDANLVLGRINPNKPIGQLPKLDVEAAIRSIERHIGQPLELSAQAAAEAMLAVANAKMAGAIRLVSIERGHDPKQFAYMPFGGGGALHVCAMMREVGVARGIVPRYPGVTSALGCVIADMRHDFVQTLNQALAQVDLAQLSASIDGFIAQGRSALVNSQVLFSGERVQIELDMLYQGQSHTIAVPLQHPIKVLSVPLIEAAFTQAYLSHFGQPLDAVPLRLLNLRVSVIGLRPKFELSFMAPDTGESPKHSNPAAEIERRQVFHANRWWEVPVMDRMALQVGQQFLGPMLFEQADTTIWLEPGFAARVDRFGNLLISAELS